MTNPLTEISGERIGWLVGALDFSLTEISRSICPSLAETARFPMLSLLPSKIHSAVLVRRGPQ